MRNILILILISSILFSFSEDRSDSDLYREMFHRSVFTNEKFDDEKPLCEYLFLEKKISLRCLEEMTVTADVEDRLALYSKNILQKYWLDFYCLPSPVSEMRMKEYYQNNMKLWQQPAKVSFQHFPFMIYPDMSVAEKKEQKSLIDHCLKKIEAGESFDDLISLYAQQSFLKESKGFVGPVLLNSLSPVMQNALLSLKEGDISSVIQTRYGLDIIRLIKRLDAYVQPFEVARSKIEKTLQNQQQLQDKQKLFAKWNTEHSIRLSEKCKVQTFEALGSEPILWVNDRPFSAKEIYQYSKFQREISLDSLIDNQDLKPFVQWAIMNDMMINDPALTDELEYHTQLTLIKNRLLAELYFKSCPIKSSENEIRAFYEEHKSEYFSTLTKISGQVFYWKIPFPEKMSSKRETRFFAESFRWKQQRLIRKYRNGSITLSELEKTAERIEPFENLKSGPKGYSFDSVAFDTDMNELSAPFLSKQELGIVHITKKNAPVPIPYSNVKKRVEYLWQKKKRQAKMVLLLDALKEEFQMTSSLKITQ